MAGRLTRLVCRHLAPYPLLARSSVCTAPRGMPSLARPFTGGHARLQLGVRRTSTARTFPARSASVNPPASL